MTRMSPQCISRTVNESGLCSSTPDIVQPDPTSTITKPVLKATAAVGKYALSGVDSGVVCLVRSNLKLATDLQWHPASYTFAPNSPPAVTFARTKSIICMVRGWLV